MSAGGSDNTYRPTKRAVRKQILPQTSSKPVRAARKDYREVEILSDSEDYEGAVSVERVHSV